MCVSPKLILSHSESTLRSTPMRSPTRECVSYLRVPSQRRSLAYAVVYVALITISLHFLGLVVRAQDTVTGAFEGIVSDSQSGARLRGALVEIINQQTRITYSLRTNYRGQFFQGRLLPGTYTIRVSLSGYQTRETAQLLRITYTGEVVPVPVALDPGTGVAAPAAAPVSAEDNDVRASIVTTDARHSGSFTDKQAVSLPLGNASVTRSFDELALLLPGVAPPPQTIGNVAGPGVGAGVGSAGQFSTNGLRSRANNFTVDGSDNNDEDIGVRRQGFVSLIPQPIESIQEYQVITALAPAQFGRNIGGQVNAVSKSGGGETHGAVYGRFNSSQLNARNFFDTTFGNATNIVRANNQNVVVQTRSPIGTVLSQETLTVQNQSGGKDSFTFAQGGVVIGGPLKQNTAFYFASFETSITNANREESFVVPTLSQRGAFGTGTTGIFQNPLNGQPTATLPTNINGAAIFSLYPFPNNPDGIYGPNSFTQTLPAGGRGTVFSGKIDKFFKLRNLQQSFTARYNFTDDWRNIPATGGAIFATLKPSIRTQNLSLFLNGGLSRADAANSIFNQLRLSFGRTRLRFEEVRDTQFLIPSKAFPNVPFLLNARELINVTMPPAAGIPSNSQVVYLQQPISVEEEIGPLGQVSIAGFSPLGVDVYNFPQRRVNNTYQLADQINWRLSNHSFTFGADTRGTDLNSELPRNARPLVTFGSSPRLIFVNDVPRFPTSSDPNPIIRAEDLAAIDAPNNLFLTLTTGGPDSIKLRFYQLNFFAQDDWRVRNNLSLSLGLRYDYNTPVGEAQDLIENTFSDPLLNQVPGLRSFINGRTSIYDADRNNFAPRLSVVYSPAIFGPDRITVLRAGFGVFYDQILGAVVSQSRNVFPSFFTLNFGGGPFTTIDQDFPLESFNPATITFGNLQIPIVMPGTLNRLNPQLQLSSLLTNLLAIFPSAISPTLPARKLLMPNAQHYSFAVEQQLDRNLFVSAAYVHTRGVNLLRFSTPNLGPALNLVPTILNVQPDSRLGGSLPVFLGRATSPPRSDRDLGGLNLFETTGRSNYNALQLQIRGTLRRALQFQAAYTLSNARDDVSDVFDLAGAFALPQNSETFAGEFGPANFDVRHRLTGNLIYSFSSTGRSPIARFLKGTVVAATGQFQTGQPFTVNSTIDVNQDGNLTDRLNTTNGLTVTGDGRQPLILNTSNTLSLLAPFGQDGAVGRNSFRAGTTLDLNLSVLKRFSISTHKSVELRMEIFNFPNRKNFAIPVRLLEAPGFGRSTSTVTPARRVQVCLKYSF